MLVLCVICYIGIVYFKVLFLVMKENGFVIDFIMVGRYKCYLLYINFVRLLFREYVENFGIILYYVDEYFFKFYVDLCM